MMLLTDRNVERQKFMVRETNLVMSHMSCININLYL